MSDQLQSLLVSLKNREFQLIQTFYPESESPAQDFKAGLLAFPQNGEPINRSTANPHHYLHSLLSQQRELETQRIKTGVGYKDGFKTYRNDAQAIWFYYVANTIITHSDTTQIVKLYRECHLQFADVLEPKRRLVSCNFKDDSDPDVGELDRAPYDQFSKTVETSGLSPFRTQIKDFLVNGQVTHALQTSMNALRFLHEEPEHQWTLQPIPIKNVFGDAKDSALFWAKLPEGVRQLYETAGIIKNLYSPQFWRGKQREDIATSLEKLGLTDHLDYVKLITLLFEHDDGKFLTPLDGFPQFIIVGDSRPTELPFKRSAMDVPLFDCNLVAHQTYPTIPGAGLSHLTMTGFHDYYKSLSYERNAERIDMPEGLHYLVRFHSCYMQHHHLALAEYASPTDWLMLPLLRSFQKCDLYSKEKPTAGDLGHLFEFSKQVERGYQRLLKLDDKADVLSVQVGFPVINF